jgi:Phage integrase family
MNASGWMDEGNRLLRTDPNFETGMIHIPGTKTEEAECYMPMSPALHAELKAYLASRTDDSPYLFPGRSAQTKGKKIYSRRRLFEKIKRATAFKVYMEKNPTATTMQAWKEVKHQGYPGGVKLTTKALRDYLATQVSDPNTVKNLMRHTSLNTTSLYTRTVQERMKEAVENLGGNSWGQLGGNSLRKKTQNDMIGELLVRLAKRRNISERNGGRSRTRTYDLAHVSNVDSEPNLAELLKELILGANAGGQQE